MTNTETARNIRCSINDIKAAAFGWNKPLNAGQLAIIDTLEAQLAEVLG